MNLRDLVLVFIAVLSKVDSVRIPGRAGITKALEIPQYRFHYYVQDEKTGVSKPYEEFKTEENIHSSFGAADSNGNVQFVHYQSDKSHGLQIDSNTKTDNSPYTISLNNPLYSSPQNDASKEQNSSSESSPIIVEPMYIQEQKSLKSFEGVPRDEYKRAEGIDKVTELIEQLSKNQTEDRNDDVKDEQVTDQVLIQDENTANKQTEFTIPFIKPNPVNADDFKNNDDEAMTKSIVNKVIQNINLDHEQSDPHLNFKSTLSDKPHKIIEADSMETERQENYQASRGHSNFKSQQVSNKPLRLFGYNPSVFGTLYDMQVNYNRPSQIQQPLNQFNQGYTAGFRTHNDDVKPPTQQQIHSQTQSPANDNTGMYFSQPISNIQTGNYKGNQKFNAPTQPLFYYDPTSMAMLPIYTNMVHNNNPVSENKPHLTPQADSNKNGFNLMQILSGGTFYKGSEQAELSHQTHIKDTMIKQESNKLEKSKPAEAYDKSKPPQTVMFYLNPNEKPTDSKSFTSNPTLFTNGQQPQADCNGQKHKAADVKPDKPLQPIPLCSDCKGYYVSAVGLMDLPSTKSVSVQPKKSIVSPQVMPIWNGQNVSKLNYLILPTPITKK